MLGYDGKWALTPDQATGVERVYSPTRSSSTGRSTYSTAYRHATEEEGRGSVMLVTR